MKSVGCCRLAGSPLADCAPIGYRVVLILGILFPLSHLFGEEKEQEPIGKLEERVSAPASKDATAYGEAERMRMKEFMNLERFISLPSERLSSIRRTIERIERMTPEEKDRLRKELHQFRQLRPEMRHEISKSFDSMPIAEKRFMRQHWLQMTPADRTRERRKMESMTAEERRDYYRSMWLGRNSGRHANGVLAASRQGPESEQAPASQSSVQGQKSTPSQKLADPKD